MDPALEVSLLLEETASPRAIALTRKRRLDDKGRGLPEQVHRVLGDALLAFGAAISEFHKASTTLPSLQIQEHAATRNLQMALRIHYNCAKLDDCLALELGAQGTHALLLRIIKWDPSNLDLSEENTDVIMELQDAACESAALYSNFPMKVAPFAPEVLAQRLPLTFLIRPVSEQLSNDSDISQLSPKDVTSRDGEVILIHQVSQRQSAQEDVGFVMWPSAVALSRWLMSNFSVLARASSILEIGAGCGLVGLLAARLLQTQSSQNPQTTTKSHRVLLSDFNAAVLDNLDRNIAVNEVTDICRTVGLDFYQQNGTSRVGWKTMDGRMQTPVDVVLAADMICQPSDAEYAANTIHDALVPNGKAFVVCADATHRYGVDHFAKECQRVGLYIETQESTRSHLVQCKEMEKTSGYVPGMNLVLYCIEKRNE